MDKQTRRAIKALKKAIRRLQHGAECDTVETKTKTEASCYGKKKFTVIRVTLFESKPDELPEREDEIPY